VVAVASEFGRIIYRLLDEYVVRPHHRALFDFPPAPDRDHGTTADPAADFGKAEREAGSTGPAP
jgi:hypothetical protein